MNPRFFCLNILTMIITNQNLLNIFRLIYYEDQETNRLLQIRSIDDELIEFAIIYDENMFLSATINKTELSSVIETEHTEDFFIKLDETYFHKIYLMAKYFSKKSTKISLDGDHVYVETIDVDTENRDLFNKDNVQFEFFNPNLQDILRPPNFMKPQCKVFSDSFRKLLELCKVDDQNIEIKLDNSYLIVKNQEGNIASSVKCESESSSNHVIILNPLQRDFIIIMLNRIMRGSVVNLYMINTLPFVVEHAHVRVYTIHVV